MLSKMELVDNGSPWCYGLFYPLGTHDSRVAG